MTLSPNEKGTIYQETGARIRRGISLVMVMMALSTSLVLSYTFLRTQTTLLRISRNGSHREQALQAAQTGAQLALREIHSPDWQGVETSFSRILTENAAGTLSYEVTLHPWTPESSQPLHPAAAALHLVLKSTGMWRPKRDSSRPIHREIEVVVRLKPRLPGRRIRPGDVSEAEDLAENPADYDAIRQYAVFAERWLTLEPGSRIEGPVWLGRFRKLYHEPNWKKAALMPPHEECDQHGRTNKKVREAVLCSIGKAYANPRPRSSHPITGPVTLNGFRHLRGLRGGDFERLEVDVEQADHRPRRPEINFSAWEEPYRLYCGGFAYKARKIHAWRLKNRRLGPTPENPLGIFYAEGNLRLRGDVHIAGTLVVDGKLTFEEGQMHIASFDGPAANGQSLLSGGDWPRLPAIIAEDVTFTAKSGARITGAVVVEDAVHSAGRSYSETSTSGIVINGPVIGRRHHLHGSPRWRDISSKTWQELYQEWKGDDDSQSDPDEPFVVWLKTAHGLTLRPTVEIRHTEEHLAQWSPPLFSPYQSKRHPEHAGYRWDVVEWRQRP